ncbi:hypothetical protein C5167_031007, partial [Papaver somniferum]
MNYQLSIASQFVWKLADQLMLKLFLEHKSAIEECNRRNCTYLNVHMVRNPTLFVRQDKKMKLEKCLNLVPISVEESLQNPVSKLLFCSMATFHCQSLKNSHWLPVRCSSLRNGETPRSEHFMNILVRLPVKSISRFRDFITPHSHAFKDPRAYSYLNNAGSVALSAFSLSYTAKRGSERQQE